MSVACDDQRAADDDISTTIIVRRPLKSDSVRWIEPQGHHFSTQLKTPTTRKRKMAAAEVYK